MGGELSIRRWGGGVHCSVYESRGGELITREMGRVAQCTGVGEGGAQYKGVRSGAQYTGLGELSWVLYTGLGKGSMVGVAAGVERGRGSRWKRGAAVGRGERSWGEGGGELHNFVSLQWYKSNPNPLSSAPKRGFSLSAFIKSKIGNLTIYLLFIHCTVQCIDLNIFILYLILFIYCMVCLSIYLSRLMLINISPVSTFQYISKFFNPHSYSSYLPVLYLHFISFHLKRGHPRFTTVPLKPLTDYREQSRCKYIY